MSDITELRQRVESLLSLPLEQKALLSQMEMLARDASFGACADLWAPALLRRDSTYFEIFLLRYLTSDNAETIRTLLPLIEQDGRDTLFTGLYSMVVDEESWNNDMLAVSQSGLPQDRLVSAVKRRDVPGKRFTLKEETASTLYELASRELGDFVVAHARFVETWVNGQPYKPGYARLRMMMRQGDDMDRYWSLFRTFASDLEWNSEIATLVQQAPSPDQIDAQLELRHPVDGDTFDKSILVKVLSTFGVTVLPYIERHLEWIGPETAPKLLPGLDALGAISLRRRIFFKYGGMKEWKTAVQSVIDQPLSDSELSQALARWTPPLIGEETGQQWRLDRQVALKLYTRNPLLFRPFIEATLREATPELWDSALLHGDDNFLDTLSVLSIRQLSNQITYATTKMKREGISSVGRATAKMLDTLGKRLIDRFDHLASQSLENYVHHAADILARGVGLAGYLSYDLPDNPIGYLATRHHYAWRASPYGIRTLMETPDELVLRIALGHLAPPDAEAARRISETLPSFNALLLGETSRNLKRQAAELLDQAARLQPEAAERILPILQELIAYRSKSSIGEEAMVHFVRARHALRQLAPTS